MKTSHPQTNVVQDEERKQDFIARVKALAKQVAQWSKEQGWEVKRRQVKVEDGQFGTYRAPELHIRVSEREEVQLIPVGMDTLGGWKWNGCVRLMVIPTLATVDFLGTDGSWCIMTGSNVPLRLRWDAATFVQLVRDMLS
jgi:hypothetical protein